jgi:hypothetical protein
MGFAFSGSLTSHAVQDPSISLDMVTSGNTYDETTNTMTVGSIDSCLTSATANPSTHNHTVHMVIENVEDLVGWHVRLNYVGDKMRPNTVNFTPFVDNTTGQIISFVNLPIDQFTGVHRDLTSASNIPLAAPGPQTARFGSSYLGNPNFAVSPDTPHKAIPDDGSYDAPTGGVLAAVNLQVVGNQSSQPALFMNLDHNTFGTGVSVFTGSGTEAIYLSSAQLGDGFHGEGANCAPPTTDSDGDGEPDGTDNCPNWPNPTQNLPPWPVPANDPDCDGFSTTVENSVGTNPLAHCGTDAWPPDINNDTFVSVVGDISVVAGQFGNRVPPAPARYDIAPDPPDRFIDVMGDISRMAGLYAQTCA